MLQKMIGVLTVLLVSSLAPGVARADGAVYAMTNALGTNEIVVFQRAGDGTLTHIQTIATGGGGSGVQLSPPDSLTSEGGLILDVNHKRLFAVNTESLAEHINGTEPYDCNEGTISSFSVAHDGRLTLVDKISSGGLFPDSLTTAGNLLYVLNAGGPGLGPVCNTGPNITGFTVRPDGQMTALADSTQPIDPGSSPGSFLNCDPGGFPASPGPLDCGLNPPAFPRSPAEVKFTPAGNQLVVTVKGTNSIYVFPIKGRRPGTPTVTQAQGPNQPTYFGFDFDQAGHLVVSEAFGASPTIPAPNAGAVSSFAIGENGALAAVSSSVANGQTTACWAVLDPRRGKFAYISNNIGNTISSYAVGHDGSLALLDAAAATGHLSPDGLPNDLAVAKDGPSDFLYALESGDGTVGSFQINRDGSLTSLGSVSGLPANSGAQGLAAY